MGKISQGPFEFEFIYSEISENSCKVRDRHISKRNKSVYF